MNALNETCEVCGADADLREENGEIVAYCTLCNDPEYSCMCDELYPEEWP